jgi:hypothetical protein
MPSMLGRWREQCLLSWPKKVVAQESGSMKFNI